jgi:hypothetical protein
MNEAQPGEPVQPLLVMVTGFGVGVVAAGAGGGVALHRWRRALVRCIMIMIGAVRG